MLSARFRKDPEQVWKYVKELIGEGLETDGTLVTGFVLGEHVEAAEASVLTERDGQVRIPLAALFQLPDAGGKASVQPAEAATGSAAPAGKGLVEFAAAPARPQRAPGLLDQPQAKTA